MLDDGRVSAYFGDRSILLSLIKSSKVRKELGIADTYPTLEPYALARGDDDFRLAVDTALSRTYRTGEIAAILFKCDRLSSVLCNDRSNDRAYNRCREFQSSSFPQRYTLFSRKTWRTVKAVTTLMDMTTSTHMTTLP